MAKQKPITAPTLARRKPGPKPRPKPAKEKDRGAVCPDLENVSKGPLTDDAYDALAGLLIGMEERELAAK